MRLLLIRHAESLGNSQVRIQGRREFPLTERGRRQADALASRLAGAGISAVYASPIGRALGTAEVIAAGLGLDVALEPRVQEYDWGMLTGLTLDDVRKKHAELLHLPEGAEEPRFPGDEGLGAFRRRVCQAFGEIVERHRADPAVAVVTHAGPIGVYLMDTLACARTPAFPFRIANASLSTLEFRTGATPGFPDCVLVGLNDTCHLDGRRGKYPKGGA